MMKIRIFSHIKGSYMTLVLCLILMHWQVPQSNAIPLPVKNEISLVEAIQLISQKYQVLFNYDRVWVSEVKVTYNPKEAIGLEEDLAYVMGQTDLKYRIFDQRYVALYRDNESGLVSMQKMVDHFQEILDEKKDIRNERNNKPVKRLKTISSQELYNKKLVLTVRGTVVDQEGEPLIGVNIQVKGTNKGTATDIDGKFILADVDENAVLIISYVGYQTQEVAIDGRSMVDVTMLTNAQLLDEVVVVGYGTMKKSDLTGAVTSLPKERLEMSPNLSIAQAIQGAMPGVMIHTSTAGAQPDQTILVRGRNSITANNDPLLILDGIPYGGKISDINPNDVESIEVLKDASAAAIYGSRRANGVILITTREGVAGKTVFSYEGRYSITDVTQVSRVLTGSEFYDFKRTRNASALTLSEKAVYDAGTSPNYTDLALRMGETQDHNISFSGGFKNTKYYLGGGVTDIKGVAKNDDFLRLTSRINVETKLTDWFSIGTRTHISYDDASGEEANFEVALETNPLSTAYDENGKLTIFPWPDNIIVGNPLQGLLYDDLDKSYQVMSNNYVSIDIPFIEGLSYRLNSGVRFRSTDRAQYRGRNTQSGLADLGRASTSNSESNNIVLENILTYNREIGNHNLFVTGLYSYEGNEGKSNALRATKFPNDFLSWYGAAEASIVSPSYSYVKSSLLSQMIRFNYSYDSRYLATITVRRDGFSGFGTDTKWGIFPSAALGWNLADEAFFPMKNIINVLKIRATYGLNGNQAIGAYESLSRFTVANYSAGSETVIGYKPSKLGLDDLGWESSHTLNLGLDFGLLRDRISGNINWYSTRTNDLLLNRSISAIHGVTPVTHIPGGWEHPAITQNIGETQNNGIEVVVNSRNLVSGNFGWSTMGNFSYNKNKIVSLYGVRGKDGKEIDDVSNKWFIGQPVRVNYDYVWDGVWQQNEADEAAKYNSQPGFAKLKDFDGDGLKGDDRRIIGQVDPKVLWGLTNTFSYKSFRLNVFIHGVHGVTVLNYLMNDHVQGAEVRYNTLKKNWWTPDNPTNDWVKNQLLADQMGGNNANIYESADYVRIKDISLSYDLPQSIIRKLGSSKVRLYVTGRNLFTITKWSGMDPELVDEDSQQEIPMQKEYVIGLSMGF